jgi:hypothetical protein
MMFFLLGVDGIEYGPYTADQIRQWMAEGRATLDTRIRRDGETESQPIRAMPEFAGLGAAAPALPPPLEPGQIAASYLARNAQVDLGSAFSRAWALVWEYPGVCMGAAVVLGISLGLAFIPLLGGLTMFVIGGPLNGGLYYLLLRRARGEHVTPGDVFAGFSIGFLQLFLAHLIASLLTMAGLILCILPGIYLAVGYLFVLPLVIDKRMEFWTALEVSRQVIHRHWWIMFGYAVLSLVILLLGAIACLVGLIVAIPLVMAALMYIYDDLLGPAAA